MARLRRVRGPKLSTDKVSIVHEMGRKYKHAKILVTIRLDPTRLKSISRSPSNGTEMENSNETTNEKIRMQRHCHRCLLDYQKQQHQRIMMLEKTFPIAKLALWITS